MTEMVERVARAIYEAMPNQLVTPTGQRGMAIVTPIPWVVVDDRDRAQAIAIARAALKSLRLPTHEMLEAANAAGSPESPALPHEVWPAMIDAAIGKGP